VTIPLLAVLLAGPGGDHDGRARQLAVAPPRIEAEVEVDGFALEDFAFGNTAGKVHLVSNVVTFSDVIAGMFSTTMRPHFRRGTG